jgi:hypothetical protein
MITVYNSVKDFETGLKTFDASAEAYVFNSDDEAFQILNTPPVGKQVAQIDMAGNRLLVIFTTTGTLAGIRWAALKGTRFYILTGAALPVPALAVPVEVRTHFSLKALEDYVKTIDPAATVSFYPDENAFVESGTINKVAASSGYTVILGAALGNLLFFAEKGGEFTTVKK